MQRDIYEIVLDTEIKAINQIKPGISYKDIHLQAALNIAEGLTQLGLMKGNPQDAVAAGAHALFFPHGLGHMIGLDVHDMEDLGEAYVGYDASVSRSTQFGLKSLRLGRKLE
ncbi:MAG: M24 family metallopeptidase, partial [Saprospiraceae bacterium]|nr:M24 family metallopeptidase [Saprospiraceae bacterium]